MATMTQIEQENLLRCIMTLGYEAIGTIHKQRCKRFRGWVACGG